MTRKAQMGEERRRWKYIRENTKIFSTVQNVRHPRRMVSWWECQRAWVVSSLWLWQLAFYKAFIGCLLRAWRFPQDTFHVSGISKFILKASCSTIAGNLFGNCDPDLHLFCLSFFSFKSMWNPLWHCNSSYFIPEMDEPDWDDKGMKKWQTYTKTNKYLRSGGLGLTREKLEHLGNSACFQREVKVEEGLFHTNNYWAGLLHISKKAGFMV